jgi:diaminohydroxyphosphoribosylaminopyrimidine deaminase/5-amino-6-(5-phosphoribosylamino)uracil reductase
VDGPGALTDPGDDERYMREALAWARKGLGRTSPNPAVGAVVVRDGQIVGCGYHRRAGEPHAEVEALRDAGPRARGATLYVTLEPCPHQGRTGPCTHAILEAGIARVVVALGRDPDPHVDGRGVAALRAAGLEVTEGVLEAEAARLNEAYLKHRRTGLPFVTLKWAMSLDGRLSARPDAPTPISGARSLRYAHELRNVHDAVMVGINTVLADDPQLTCRIPRGRDPARLVLDSRLRMPPDARMLRQPSPAPTIVFAGEDAPAARAAALRAAGAEVVILPGRRPAIRAVLAWCAARGMLSVMVEGGSTVQGAVLAEGMADRVAVVVAPGLVGSRDAPAPAGGPAPLAGRALLRLREVTVRRLGEDVLIEGYLPWATERVVRPRTVDLHRMR